MLKHAYSEPETNRLKNIENARKRVKTHSFDFILNEKEYDDWFHNIEEDIVVFGELYLGNFY